MEHINLWEDEKLRNQVQFLRELVALYRGSKGARIPCERVRESIFGFEDATQVKTICLLFRMAIMPI